VDLTNNGRNPGEGTPSQVPDMQSQLDAIVRQAEIGKTTHRPLPGARPMPLSLFRTAFLDQGLRNAKRR